MRLGIGEILIILLLIFLLFGNYSKLKIFFFNILKKFKNE
jgi:Sec-independent protein translocase protein TatA